MVSIKEHSGTETPRNVLVKDHFERHAQEWQLIYSATDFDSYNIQRRQSYVLDYVDKLGLESGARILDLGCGAGVTSAELLRRGFVVLGIDVSENMLRLAREICFKTGLGHNATFRQGSAEELDLDDNSFSAVVAMGLIEYLDWDRWTLQEIHRVLQPGGYLVVTVPNKARLSYLVDPITIARLLVNDARKMLDGVLRRLHKAEMRLGGRPIHLWFGSGSTEKFSRNLYVPGRLKRMLADLDFEILHSVSHGFGPFRLLSRSTELTYRLDRILQQASERKMLTRLSELGSNYIVLCRKRIEPLEVAERHVLSSIEERIETFRSERRKLFSQLDAWLRRNPEYAHQELQEFDDESTLGGSVLIISPHPDDEIIGCGGSLIRMLENGAKVTVLQLTDGSNTVALRNCTPDVRKKVRLREAEVVAKELGLRELIMWKEADGHIKCTSENVIRLARILDRLRPSSIFVPFVNDTHRDHVIATEILRKALESSAVDLHGAKVLSYEVWSLLPPNCFRVIDGVFDKKTKLLMKYRTGMKASDYVHYCESLASYHSYTLLGRKGFVEVFLALEGKTYLKLPPSRLIRRRSSP